MKTLCIVIYTDVQYTYMNSLKRPKQTKEQKYDIRIMSIAERQFRKQNK